MSHDTTIHTSIDGPLHVSYVSFAASESSLSTLIYWKYCSKTSRKPMYPIGEASSRSVGDGVDIIRKESRRQELRRYSSHCIRRSPDYP